MSRTAKPEETLIYELVDLTIRLAAHTEALIGDVMTELDVTQPLADVLWQLDPTLPAPSMRDLAMKLRCDPSSVTFLADRLEAKGLATRKVNPSNRRMKTLQLTAKGRRARRTLVNAMATHSPIGRLSIGDQQQLHRLLTTAVIVPQTPCPPCA